LVACQKGVKKVRRCEKKGKGKKLK
jgi:hypothetical protein